MDLHTSVILQLGVGILLIAFSNNFRIKNSTDVFVAEIENITNTGGNGTFKFNYFRERFDQLMDIADSMSERIIKLVNVSDAQALFIASEKLTALQEKVENYKLNITSNDVKPKKSTEQTPKEKYAEEYMHHVSIMWTGSGYPLVALNTEIRYFLSRNMTEVEQLSLYCTMESISPVLAATDYMVMTLPMVRAQINVDGPDSLDVIYALFARRLLQLTFYQAICDPSVAMYTTGAPFYRNKFYSVTMNKIFKNMDNAMKWSKDEYEANIVTVYEYSNSALYNYFSYGNLLVIALLFL